MKKALIPCLGLAMMMGLTPIANAQDQEAKASAPYTAMATIINNNKETLGNIKLRQAPKGVLVHVDLEGLKTGPHGFHIHQTGTCADNSDFKNSGGHIGNDTAMHGFMNEDGYEPGDLPNLIVPESGSVEVEFFVADLKIGDGSGTDDPMTLLDDDGAAFMIHENPDDYMTQPIGGAGARIACGAVEKTMTGDD